jgi:hypothetical protein
MDPRLEPRATTRAAARLAFDDTRPPLELRAHLERVVLAVFEWSADEPRLEFRATRFEGALRFDLRLRFEALVPAGHRYVLEVELTTAAAPEQLAKPLPELLSGWMGVFTHGWAASAESPPAPEDPLAYRRIVEAARVEDASLREAGALERDLLRRIRAGAFLETLHKEGSTRFAFVGGRWTRSEDGESRSQRVFDDERDFIADLARHLATRIGEEPAGDGDAARAEERRRTRLWRLGASLLESPASFDTARAHGAEDSGNAQRWVLAWGLVVATSFVLVGARVRAELFDRPLSPSIAALTPAASIAFLLAVVVAVVWLRRHWR